MRSSKCVICGDSEPSHVHYEGRRLEDFYTVGRGEVDMDAARRWKARALEAERTLEAIAIYLRQPHTRIGEACGIDACIICLAESNAVEVLGKRGHALG